MKKTVLITGSSTGIGKAAAIYFSHKDWNVAATMRSPEKHTELKALPNVKLYKLDVLDDATIQDTIESVRKDFGGIDVLVNNAGYGAVGAFESATKEQIQKQFDTNVFGLMNVCRAILPYFREKKDGTIINIASIGGRLTFPLYSLYHGTKWAVEGFSEALQYEVRDFNIKIRIIEPGSIKTDFNGRSQDFFKREGFTVYDNYTKLVMGNVEKAVQQAPGPEVVAKKIFEAAITPGYKMRFPVGSNAPALLIMRRLLPDSWFSGIVRSILEKK